MSVVIVMCQGQQRRLPNLTHSKHMLEVGGEPILSRTLRLLATHIGGASKCPVVVFGNKDLMPALQAGERAGLRSPLLAQFPAPGTCVVDGILAARAAWDWDGRTTILLGDVVWSSLALTAFLLDQRPLVFAGTPDISNSGGEVFGVSFTNEKEMTVLTMSCPCRKVNFSIPQGGHLRRLLWHAQAQRGLVAPDGQTWHPDLYLPITDWTDDVDTPADVARLPELGQRCLDEVRVTGWVYFDMNGDPTVV